MNEDKMKGKWNQLKRKWGKVTDNDLLEAEGNVDKVVGIIQQRTGEQKEAIQSWLKAQGY